VSSTSRRGRPRRYPVDGDSSWTSRRSRNGSRDVPAPLRAMHRPLPCNRPAMPSARAVRLSFGALANPAPVYQPTFPVGSRHPAGWSHPEALGRGPP
jgi:hypothetical protein